MFAQSPNSQRGFSLIELMVGGTVGMVMLFAVSAVFLSSQRASRQQRAQSEIAEEGRYALDTLKRFVMQAGYRQPDLNIPSATAIFPPAPLNSEAIGSTGSDLILRFQGYGSLAYGCDGAAINLGTGNDWNQMSIALDSANKKITCTPSSVATGGATGGAAGTAVDLVGGTDSAVKVTAFELQFGYDDTTNPSKYDVGCMYSSTIQGDCLADSYKTAAQVGSNWNRVVAVRVCLKMETVKDAFEVSTAQKVLSCTDGSIASQNSKKLIRTFTTTSSLRNLVRAKME
ncbi:hypothetical protein FNU76_09510 [Chitinimonas arctica]|uniref:Prepilin-type N-terminal cleavage/methylation domain-containing protein n=1 Tax=Chitinimonas arctica TaxID=2594795 RepID=A0A516SM92_9NEIS|nr:PilW family protein [Chitinimonas arctica]QDQ29255.1 hypothetical protein FNU76_09510 [Chitinimonas arctica]